MYGFHTFLHFIGIRAIKDTQCGFKLFTRCSCALIFPSMHVERWAFDVECLYLAERQGIPMVEVPVAWHEVLPLLCGRGLTDLGSWIKAVSCEG
jgi:dolichyl-phosphate beta-glucosyltransferase